MVVTRRDHIKKIPKFEPFEVLTILCEDYVLSFFVTFCNSIISLREGGGLTPKNCFGIGFIGLQLGNGGNKNTNSGFGIHIVVVIET